ncbi:carbohydrate ABC transporter permease [uncultured Abiotrophia sp.]|uniref:carbohydrate ABC transporter permease n=1 Tax=uncultured Abiotrophia sp. TaxID=316094 RepID=UPI0028E9139E|nr:carbohydrate ABC transporter permease [uncultured Abiotrophia sp.]
MTQTKKKLGKVSVDTFGPKANFFFSLLMTLVGLTGVFPFIFVIILSLTDENSIVRNGYRLIPDAWSTAGYEYLFTQSSTIVNAFMVTVFVTVVGTLINVTVTSTYAYALSRPYFIFRRFFLFIILVTMLVGAGMVPSYIVMTSLLKLRNSIWALILPMALSPFNVIIMRTFFRKSIPESIIESARIDGAGEFRIFRQIVLPLAIPGIATISLFAAIGFWNDWFSALLYLDDQNLFPLQYVLMQIQANIDYIVKNAAQGASTVSGVSIPREATRMAMVVISTLPIALSYPFFQKYFISGLTIGGVKE